MAMLKMARVSLGVHHASQISHSPAALWVPSNQPTNRASIRLPGCIWRWGARALASGEKDLPEAQRMPSRLALTQKSLLDSAPVEDANLPIPKILIEHVSLSFARSGGAGGQNVNKVNTKVDMRFNVMAAQWLPERVKLKLLEMEKNRINSEGEVVVSSTRTRTQKGNIDDALQKLQEMINAASYVPPPPSEETKKRIQKLARIENERRLQDKKRSSSKKSDRRNKGSWD